MSKKLGFVLGAGGSRGVAHIGFLEAMEENGIKPDFISGSSMGSVVGGCYAAGMTPDEMKTAIFDLKKSDLLDLTVNPVRSQALFKSKKMHSKIEEYLGKKTFKDLKIPFSCVAVDLITGEPVYLDGDMPVAEAIAASSSIPGVFKPVKKDEKLLVDGGLRERLPVDLVRQMGAEAVVAVDVLGELRIEEKPYNLITVLFRTLDIYDSGVTELRLKKHKPDILIRPDMGNISQYKFNKFPVAYEAGYDSGIKYAEKIKKLIKD